MFDMGFEPQLMRMVQNIRPDRQTVLFSATFPRQVETLARKILNDPVEIQVSEGGRGAGRDPMRLDGQDCTSRSLFIFVPMASATLALL